MLIIIISITGILGGICLVIVIIIISIAKHTKQDGTSPSDQENVSSYYYTPIKVIRNMAWLISIAVNSFFTHHKSRHSCLIVRDGLFAIGG